MSPLLVLRATRGLGWRSRPAEPASARQPSLSIGDVWGKAASAWAFMVEAEIEWMRSRVDGGVPAADFFVGGSKLEGDRLLRSLLLRL
jgi:hypothetical protein